MDIKQLQKILFITTIVLSFQLPAFSAKKDEALIEVPKTYPAKYTSQYINEIKPIYKSVGKDEIFYVALDMLKGTNGEFYTKPSKMYRFNGNSPEFYFELSYDGIHPVKVRFARFIVQLAFIYNDADYMAE